MLDVSEGRVGRALNYLAESDAEMARRKAYMVGIEEQKKTVYAKCYLKYSGPVEERKSNALDDPEYLEHIEKYEAAVLDHETMRNKRLTAALIIEVWRSLNANRRQGS